MFDPNAVFDAVLIRIKVVIDFLRLKLQEGSQTVNPMIDQNITDKLTSAARDWATVAGRELQEQPILKEAFHACLNDADVQIVVKLRHGAIELQGSTENKYILLHRNNVEPMCSMQLVAYQCVQPTSGDSISLT